MTSTTTDVTTETRFWHPFADMSAVKNSEFVVERGEDVWVWGTDGRRYFDGTASLWYANVGHGRPEIAAAVAAQMAKLEAYSAFGDFGNGPATELAQRLSDLAPMPAAKVFFGSGGGDGIEIAAKLARRYWNVLGQPQRTTILSRENSYHGTHGFGTAIAGLAPNREGYGDLFTDTERVSREDAATSSGRSSGSARTRSRRSSSSPSSAPAASTRPCRVTSRRSPTSAGAPACC